MTSSSKPHAAVAGEQLKEISVFSQSFPPEPAFTDDKLPSLSGKTVLITGATSGIGLEVAKIAFSHGASVNISGRTRAKLDLAIQEVKKTKSVTGDGNVTGIVLDLADLAKVKESATSFLQTNTRLDILIHNAGVMKPLKGSKTKIVRDPHPLSKMESALEYY
jgi:NAD(P)-dependent dehydrogenase (short-subunit alcohol dehydrogenase family)